MKRIVCMICCAVMIVSMCSAAMASDNELLSDLSDEECIEFLTDYGVAIPTGNVNWMQFIRFVIASVEENPNAEFLFGYTVALEFAEKIKIAVNEYYGISDVSSCAIIDTDAVLLDNVLYGS